MSDAAASDIPGEATHSGDAHQAPLLTAEQEAMLLPILTAAFAHIRQEASRDGDLLPGVLAGCGCGTLVIVSGVVGAGLLDIGWLAAVSVGVGVIAAIAVGCPVVVMMMNERTERERAVASGLSESLHVPLGDVEALFRICLSLEQEVRASQKHFFLLAKTWAVMLPSGTTQFEAPPIGLANRRALAALVHDCLAVVTATGTDNIWHLEMLRVHLSNVQRLADEIAQLVRRLSSGGQTAPSAPTGLRVSFLKYSRCYPVWPLVFVVAVGGAAILTVLSPGNAAYLVGALVLAAFWWFFLVRFSLPRQCRGGFIRPAVVVATDPYLVAVYANLTMGGIPWHVVKIVRQPLGAMAGGAPPVGTRLAIIMVGFRGGDSRKGHWDDFDVTVVACVTASQAEADRALASIPAEEWQALEAGLIQVPIPYKPGLWPIQLG